MTLKEKQILIINKVHKLFNDYGWEYNIPLIKFSNAMKKCAGLAQYNRNNPNSAVIKFSNSIIELNDFDKFINSTVPHEVAHIIAAFLHNSSGHDRAWKICYAKISGQKLNEVKRCHSYQTAATTKRKKYEVKCQCTTHKVGPKVYNNIKTGVKKYHCKICKGNIII